jgi:hypothetical protein
MDPRPDADEDAAADPAVAAPAAAEDAASTAQAVASDASGAGAAVVVGAECEQTPPPFWASEYAGLLTACRCDPSKLAKVIACSKQLDSWDFCVFDVLEFTQQPLVFVGWSLLSG